jgi:hypothetical protein
MLKEPPSLIARRTRSAADRLKKNGGGFRKVQHSAHTVGTMWWNLLIDFVEITF